MSQLLYGSICVSDLPQNRMKQAANGKWYLDINIWINDQVDQYGNIAGVSVGQTKEERERKDRRTYIGNLKTPQGSAPAAPQAAPQYAPAAPQGYPAAPGPNAPAPTYAGYQQPAAPAAAPAPALDEAPF